MPFGTFLNGRNATQLRGLAWLSLSDYAQIGTRTYASDNGGGATETWTYGSTIPCRVDAVAGLGVNEDIIGERLSDRSTHSITLSGGTIGGTVTASSRIRVVGRGTYEVTAIEERTAEWLRFAEAAQIF